MGIMGALGSMVPGVGSYLGQRSANRFNRREAQKSRDFSERMRNTEWQAGVRDMEAAGLNPALAYQQGGASSPSGAVAAAADSEIGAGISSAQAQRRLEADLGAIRATTAKTVSEGQYVQAQTRIAERAASVADIAAPAITNIGERLRAINIQPRDMHRVGYVAGSSARQMFDSVKRTVARLQDMIKANWERPSIGPNTTGRN